MRAARLLLAIPLVLVACESDPDTEPVPAADLAAEAEASPAIYRGTLEAGDETLASGEYLESYEVLAREGQWIRAEVLSGDFDPYLIVLSPTNVQTDVDDSAAGNTSMTRAVVQADEAGEWRVVVTTFEPGESGDFELTLEALDEEPDDADTGTQVGLEDEPATDA